MMDQPSTNGDNGRTAAGQFAPGNKLGRGNPHAGHVARLRSALLNAVTVEDIEEVVASLVRLAKDGDLQATKKLFSRVLGRPLEADLLERLEALEGREG